MADASTSGDANATIKRALDADRGYACDVQKTTSPMLAAIWTRLVNSSRSKDLLTLPARDNLQVIETPEFMRGIYSVGGFNPAPALEPQLGAFYWITPIPSTWPKERIESKLREYNYLRAEDPDHSRSDARSLRAIRVRQRCPAATSTSAARGVRQWSVRGRLGGIRNRSIAGAGLSQRKSRACA